MSLGRAPSSEHSAPLRSARQLAPVRGLRRCDDADILAEGRPPIPLLPLLEGAPEGVVVLPQSAME